MMVAHSSPDEWATTKQVCKDEIVVYLFFSPLYILYIYIYIKLKLPSGYPSEALPERVRNRHFERF